VEITIKELLMAMAVLAQVRCTAAPMARPGGL
jgi:hypothetical protein